MNRIAEFEAEGQKFIIYKASELNGDKSGLNDAGPVPIAGEVVINETKYFIVSAEDDCRDCKSADEGKRFNALTKRETQIVIMVAQGLVNKVIADRLHISEWTVSTHMRRIFAKLHVDSRAEMVYQCAKLIAMHSNNSLNP
jgi:DNA-binding CsgD family transcriptional regulator